MSERPIKLSVRATYKKSKTVVIDTFLAKGDQVPEMPNEVDAFFQETVERELVPLLQKKNAKDITWTIVSIDDPRLRKLQETRVVLEKELQDLNRKIAELVGEGE